MLSFLSLKQKVRPAGTSSPVKPSVMKSYETLERNLQEPRATGL